MFRQGEAGIRASCERGSELSFGKWSRSEAKCSPHLVHELINLQATVPLFFDLDTIRLDLRAKQ
jgi:hypothetical protein